MPRTTSIDGHDSYPGLPWTVAQLVHCSKLPGRIKSSWRSARQVVQFCAGLQPPLCSLAKPCNGALGACGSGPLLGPLAMAARSSPVPFPLASSQRYMGQSLAVPQL